MQERMKQITAERQKLLGINPQDRRVHEKLPGIWRQTVSRSGAGDSLYG
jgi:hypothetical protein